MWSGEEPLWDLNIISCRSQNGCRIFQQLKQQVYSQEHVGRMENRRVFNKISECDVRADCLIDFSIASAVDSVLEYCVEKKLPCVLCTTGLGEEQLKKAEKAADSIRWCRP